ncbi:hypothetical protein P4V41_07815 [Fictibacillus nanhaiensis]|uniref:hypothetical protein n=1 Tax=Fictibacillus nanhaiensis TaxID=742169 RepID=UPI002E232146|nr:hypothetical protein [Fictibacillus nanhaiensis]
MRYELCPEAEATHVRVTENIHEMDLTVGEVYEIHRNEEPGFEGEEMIRDNNGVYNCSFSLVVEVDWLKKI